MSDRQSYAPDDLYPEFSRKVITGPKDHFEQISACCVPMISLLPCHCQVEASN